MSAGEERRVIALYEVKVQDSDLSSTFGATTPESARRMALAYWFDGHNGPAGPVLKKLAVAKIEAQR